MFVYEFQRIKTALLCSFVVALLILWLIKFVCFVIFAAGVEEGAEFD